MLLSYTSPVLLWLLVLLSKYIYPSFPVMDSVADCKTKFTLFLATKIITENKYLSKYLYPQVIYYLEKYIYKF